MREVERLTIVGTMAGQRQTSEWGIDIEKRYGVALESTVESTDCVSRIFVIFLAYLL